ncbi:MAG TPA: TetR/AcrR family transcriptional regulator, partial [Actinobacteria bacterium]|nr:TetR/AcrR family transcriptional regulator [Actinomycetota bacterium]
MTRRERLREELVAEIKNAARTRLNEAGAAELSLRGIARDVGMSPASLYTYFDGLDDVITALIVDSFDDQAAAIRVAAAGARSVQTRLRRATVAYRDWAHKHPEEFRLLYESPIAGYQAPEDGPTVDAAIRVMTPFMELLHEAWTTGEIEAPPPGPPIDTKAT